MQYYMNRFHVISVIAINELYLLFKIYLPFTVYKIILDIFYLNNGDLADSVDNTLIVV